MLRRNYDRQGPHPFVGKPAVKVRSVCAVVKGNAIAVPLLVIRVEQLRHISVEKKVLCVRVAQH